MMSKEQIREKVKEMEDWNFEETFKKSRYSKSPSIWEKYGKFRIYVPRNAYEQAGYICIDEDDKHSDEYQGFYLQPTRPGNLSILQKFVNDLLRED